VLEATLDTDQRYRAVVENANDLICEIDAKGRFLYISPVAGSLLGWVPEEHLGQSLLEHAHPDDREEVMAAIARARASGAGEATFRVRHEDGSWRWFAGTGKCYRTADGECRVVGIGRDITQHKRTEERLLMLERAVQQSIDGIAVAYLDGVIQFANPSWARMHGYDAEELPGRPLTILHTDEQMRESVTPFNERVREVGAHEGEVGHVRKDGTTFTTWMTTTLLTDEKECPIGLVGVARDMAEQKRVGQELAAHQEHLEELVERRTRELEASHEQIRSAKRLASIGTLAAGVAHEINNPVGAILIAARAGLRNLEQSADPEITAQVLNLIARQAERCGRIVKGILKFSRHGTSDKRRENVNDIVRAVHDLLRVEVERHGAVMTLALDQNLPSIRLNPTEIQQVIVNLVQNAAQAGARRVTVRTEGDEDCVRLVVEDDGCGIAPEHRERLFEPFYTTREAGGGTGLGLSITHGIVADHGGSIGVEPEPGKGTSMTVRLPRATRTARKDKDERASG